MACPTQAYRNIFSWMKVMKILNKDKVKLGSRGGRGPPTRGSNSKREAPPQSLNLRVYNKNGCGIVKSWITQPRFAILLLVLFARLRSINHLNTKTRSVYFQRKHVCSDKISKKTFSFFLLKNKDFLMGQFSFGGNYCHG